MLQALRTFLSDFAAYAGRRGAWAAALVLVGALFEGIGLALIVPLLGIIFATGKAGGRLAGAADALFASVGLASPFARLAVLLGIFALVMVIRAVVILARDMMLATLRIGFVEAQRMRVAELLAAASWDKVVRLRHARVAQAISVEVQLIGTAAQFMTQGMTAATMLLAQVALAFAIAPPFALLTCLLLAAGGLALPPMMRRARRLGSSVSDANQDLMHGTAQFLGGLKLAISQNLQPGFLAEFHDTLQSQRDRQIGYVRQQTTSRLAITTLSALVGVALVLVGLAFFHIAPTLLIALLLIVSRMSGPFSQIQQGTQMLANALPSYEKVMALQADLADAPDEACAPAADCDGEIRFESVGFRHAESDEDAAHGVAGLTLRIAPGENLGIGGASGAGKTTLADLLAGLYPPQTGRITVGGRPLDGAVLKCWRSRIAYVTQDPFLFHDSVRRNLAWANPEADEAAMWQALALAEADGFVRSLPQGLDTVAGERGTLMSGGERQRIALARAILRRPRLLILDEATNAVDPATEGRILARLASLNPRPTIVTIAHRKGSLEHCDRILTLRNGLMT